MRTCATTLVAEMTEKELLFLTKTIKEHKKKGRYLEIGTAAGGTLCHMMQCFTSDSRPNFVVVDPMTYFPGQMEVIYDNLRQQKQDPCSVDFRVKTSLEAFKEAKNNQETFNFILIDGAHKIKYVTQDLQWLSLLNVGGLAAFHDFNDKHPGLQVAIKNFLKKNPHYQVLGSIDSLLIVKKSSPTVCQEVSLIDKAKALLYSPYFQIKRAIDKRLS